jgi:hypothetical protein
MPEVLEPAVVPASVSPSALLGGKILRLRQKHVSTAALTGVAMAVGVGIELLALAMFFDWWLDWPWALRLASLLVQLTVFTFIVLRFIVAPLVHQPDDDDLALLVEKAQPEFRSRLIASIQLARPHAIPPGQSAALAEAMIEQAEAVAAPMDFNTVVPADKLKKLGTVAGAVAFLGAVGLVWGRPDTSDLLKRAFLSNIPVPRKTRVIVPEGNRIIGRGDGVRLEAYVRGIIPGAGRVEVKYRGRRLLSFPLEQNKDNRAHFGRTIENVQDSFTYVMYLGDGRSEPFEIKTIPRPTVSTIQCEQEFPAYTQLKPVRRSLGDLALLAGSVLKLKITATKPIQAALIKVVGREQEIPLQVDAANPRELSGQLAIPTNGMNGFSIQMLDTENMESRDSAVYRIDLLPDKVPVVRVTYPDRKEELITRQATLLIGFEASDDFAIAGLWLKYKVDSLDNAEAKTVELDLAEQRPRSLKRRYEWKIGALNPLLKEGSLIEYWIEAQDNNDTTGPGLGSSDHQFAKVVSEAEKRADLLNRAGDYLGSISDVATDQEKLNKTLGAIILEKPAGR